MQIYTRYQQTMMVIMSNRTKLILGSLFTIAFILGKVNSKKFIDKKISNINQVNVEQYLNRLNEFFIEDIYEAKNDFLELLDMGFNPSDCFEITIAKNSLL